MMNEIENMGHVEETEIDITHYHISDGKLLDCRKCGGKPTMFKKTGTFITDRCVIRCKCGIWHNRFTTNSPNTYAEWWNSAQGATA